MILIIEDDYTSYLLLKTVLEDINNRHLYAENGQQGIALLNKHKENIKLILSDIKLPDMSGHELIPRMKDISPNLPIIAITAYAMKEDSRKCFDAGCDDYISKPINIKNFINTINKYLQKAR